jgi:mono/diheme cytochrome c family protein
VRIIAIIGSVGLAACVAEPEVDGRAAYLENCAGCHGATGQGDGVIAAGLDVAVPDLTQIAARNGGVYDSNAVMSTIDGLNRAPHFASYMPEFGAGDLGDPVMVENNGLTTPVPAVLLALNGYLESIQE